MENVVTVAFTLGLVLTVAITAHLATSTKGSLGAWIAGVTVLLALVFCASVSPKVAAGSVLVAVFIFRAARWFRDQDKLGPRASAFYRLM